MGRSWIPEEYLDEITPPGRATPADWIEDVGSLTLRLASGWSDETPGRRLAVGDHVGFYWCDELGTVFVTVGRDGLRSIEGEVDPAATHFWIAGDPGSLADSMDEMVQTLVAGMEPDALKEGVDCERTEVQLAAWALKAIAHRLDMIDDKPTFTQAVLQ